MYAVGNTGGNRRRLAIDDRRQRQTPAADRPLPLPPTSKTALDAWLGDGSRWRRVGDGSGRVVGR